MEHRIGNGLPRRQKEQRKEQCDKVNNEDSR